MDEVSALATLLHSVDQSDIDEVSTPAIPLHSVVGPDNKDDIPTLATPIQSADRLGGVNTTLDTSFHSTDWSGDVDEVSTLATPHHSADQSADTDDVSTLATPLHSADWSGDVCEVLCGGADGSGGVVHYVEELSEYCKYYYTETSNWGM
jgi:hypothetical protein